jgi:hypothetical protein
MVMKIVKLDQLPASALDADTLYLKRNLETQDFEAHVTDREGETLYPLSGTHSKAEIVEISQDGAFTQPDRVLVYTGYPGMYKGLLGADKVAADMAANYDIVVLGSGYQVPGHVEYGRTVTLMAALGAKGVKVYGTVPCGVNTTNLTVEQITTLITQWATLGVDGLFLKEFGFGTRSSRTRQQQIVAAVRAVGKVYAASSAGYADVLLTSIGQVPGGEGDWMWNDFAAWNPTNLPLDFGIGDTYVLENYVFSPTGPKNVNEGFAYYTNLRAALATLPGRGFWGISVFAETGDQVDTTKIGNFTLVEDAVAYVWASGLALNATGVGIVGSAYGVNGTIISAAPYRLPTLSIDRNEYVYDPTGTPSITRTFGEMAIKLTANNSAVLGLEIIDNRKTLLSGVYPRAAATDYVTQAELNVLLADIQAALTQINGV